MGVGWVRRYAGASVGIGKCVRVLGAGPQQLGGSFCAIFPAACGQV